MSFSLPFNYIRSNLPPLYKDADACCDLVNLYVLHAGYSGAMGALIGYTAR